MSGYLYIIQEREMIRLNEPTVKIGMTGRFITERTKEYPNDSVLLATMHVSDRKSAEQYLIKKFDNNFRQVPEYGREYYNGESVIEMVNYFLYCCMEIQRIQGRVLTYESAPNIFTDDPTNDGSATSICIDESMATNMSSTRIIKTAKKEDNKSLVSFCQFLYETQPEWYVEDEYVPLSTIIESYEEYMERAIPETMVAQVSKQMNGIVYNGGKRVDSINYKKLVSFEKLEEYFGK